MACRHDEGLGARWDYLSHDETSATGWIVCRSCGALLERLSVAGGSFRGQGRYVSAFREQLSEESALLTLSEMEAD
jgi:predicted nucleic acid-binding Zn ribbon protein